MESAMTAILRDASGKMHHGILFDRRLSQLQQLCLLLNLSRKVTFFKYRVESKLATPGQINKIAII